MPENDNFERITLHLIAAAKEEGVDLEDEEAFDSFMNTVARMAIRGRAKVRQVAKKMANKSSKSVVKKAAQESVNKLMKSWILEE